MCYFVLIYGVVNVYMNVMFTYNDSTINARKIQKFTFANVSTIAMRYAQHASLQAGTMQAYYNNCLNGINYKYNQIK